jgi:eukaryotic-like serine/threonine-protein kinase
VIVPDRSLEKRDNLRESLLAALTPPDEAARAHGPDSVVGSAFAAGAVLAGRYRMVSRIGRGGMGEVWRADDLVLNTAIALKFVDSATDADRERILKEVRLARQITHPAVCRVFDIGEADGKVFYSMELIEGEDLATLLRHAGRLPSEKVLEIGQQLCAGLAAAHAQGVLHRDLKPANVLIDDAGAVRVTDFGIAIARKDAAQHTLIGTPGYMAPEQLSAGGAPLSEQTDLYALGLILYELVVGQRPFPENTRPPGVPPRLSAAVPDVDPRIERAVMHALAPDPRERPRSAAEMAATLEGPASQPPTKSRFRPWLAGSAVALAVVAVAVFASRVLPSKPALTDRDTIILSDFVNTTNEPVFDGALKVALAVALEQSAFLKVFPDESARQTLRLMQRSPDERLTRQIARDVAQREQLKALVAGSIGRLGSHYVLALEAVNAATGDVMAREQIEAASSEEVLTALGQVTSRLRQKLGESLASIQRFDVALPRATTASLEALHSYALALDQGRIAVARIEAIPHLRRAIEIDPDFAMAHATLAAIYRNTGRTTEAAPIAQRAFELRDRVSERERYFISWRFYMDTAQAWDKALELSTSWSKTYPREAFAFNSMGLASAAFGQHDRAVPAFREAIRLDPRFVAAYTNLSGSLIALNRFDEARAALDEAERNGVDFISLRQPAYVLGFIGNDAAIMARELKRATATPEGLWASNWEARDRLFQGRFQLAHDRYEQSVQAAIRENFPEFAAQWSAEDAEGHALAEQCDAALREVAAALDLRRDNFTLERAGRTLALCGADSRASAVLDELSRRFPDATLTARLHRPVILAAIALHRGDAARAVSHLEPVRPFDHAPAAEFWPSYLRGLAHLQLKDGRSAAAAFGNIVNHRGEAPTSPLYGLAHLGLARAAVLTNDSAGARKEFDAFFGIWKDADPDVPAVRQARAEYARLQ